MGARLSCPCLSHLSLSIGAGGKLWRITQACCRAMNYNLQVMILAQAQFGRCPSRCVCGKVKSSRHTEKDKKIVVGRGRGDKEEEEKRQEEREIPPWKSEHKIPGKAVAGESSGATCRGVPPRHSLQAMGVVDLRAVHGIVVVVLVQDTWTWVFMLLQGKGV